MRRDRTMVVLALMGAACVTLAWLAIFYLGGYFGDPDRLVWLGLIAAYPSTLIGVFFNVALACAAGAALDGLELTVGEALAASFRRRRQIALWALLAAGVGTLLNELASRIPAGGRIATWLLGAAWSLATIFVVPILALEETSALPAIRRSARLVRSRWEEAVSGSLTIWAWMVVVLIPVIIVFCTGASMIRAGQDAGVAVVAVGLASMVAIGVLAAALAQVFAVALYRFAADGSVAPG